MRTVGADQWASLRALRLRALSDPAARVAFCDDYVEAREQPAVYWQERSTPIAEGGRATNLVVVAEDGTWAGMLAVLAAAARSRGAKGDAAGGSGREQRAHVVSVYVLPEHRGTGAAELLLREALDWTWRNTPAQRVLLWVHEANPRARAFYQRLGFAPTGNSMPFPPAPEEWEHELEISRPAG